MKLTKTILTVLALGVCSLTFGQSNPNDSPIIIFPLPEQVAAPRQNATVTSLGQTGGEKVTDSQIEATIAKNYPGEQLSGGLNAVRKQPINPVLPVIAGGRR